MICYCDESLGTRHHHTMSLFIALSDELWLTMDFQVGYGLWVIMCCFDFVLSCLMDSGWKHNKVCHRWILFIYNYPQIKRSYTKLMHIIYVNVR